MPRRKEEDSMDPWHQSSPPAVSTTLGTTNSFVAEANTATVTSSSTTTVPIVDAGAQQAISDEAGLDNVYNTSYEAEASGSCSESVNASSNGKLPYESSNGKSPYDIEKCLEIADASRSQVTSATCANPDVANILKEIIADPETCIPIRDAAMITLESVHRYPVRIRNEEDFLEL